MTRTTMRILCGAIAIAFTSITAYASAADTPVARFRVTSRGGVTIANWSLSNTPHTLAAGDVLEYRVLLRQRRPGLGQLDLVTNQSLRLSLFPVTDEHGIGLTPDSDLSSKAFGTWYTRRIAIPSQMIGQQIVDWQAAVQGMFETGERAEAAYTGIRIVRKGRSVCEVFTGNQPMTNEIRMATEQTLEEAVLVRLPLSEPIRTATDWFDCMLPRNEYIGIHAEGWDDAQQKWVPVTQVLQPFRSELFRPWNVGFWRKDSMEPFYGELFTYDLTTIRLHTETMPPRAPHEPESQPSWDARPDRVRLFVQTSNGYAHWFTDRTIIYDWTPYSLARLTTGAAQWKLNARQPAGENWAIGRALAPIHAGAEWQFHGTANTYLANSYEELNDGTAPLFQISIHDYATISRIAPFDCVYDGEADGWPADPEFRRFDEALVFNQHMNNNAARERFIFARKGDTYYGLVRWDVAELRSGRWVVTGRATGLKRRKTDGPFPMDGMYDRVRNDRWIAPRTHDMAVINPQAVPSLLPHTSRLRLQNTGLAPWTADGFAVYARLLDAKGVPIAHTERQVGQITETVPCLAITDVPVSWPEDWPTTGAYLELEMRHGDRTFRQFGGRVFIRRLQPR